MKWSREMLAPQGAAVVAPVAEGVENVKALVAAATSVEVEVAAPAARILAAVAVATVAMAVVDDNTAFWCVPAKLPALAAVLAKRQVH